MRGLAASTGACLLEGATKGYRQVGSTVNIARQSGFAALVRCDGGFVASLTVSDGSPGCRELVPVVLAGRKR